MSGLPGLSAAHNVEGCGRGFGDWVALLGSVQGDLLPACELEPFSQNWSGPGLAPSVQ